jgi:hypothetical protein
MIAIALASVLIAYLPGAVLFRLPVAERTRRASLPVEERIFWHVVISLAWSLAVVLVLAALGAYRLDWVMTVNGVLVAALLVAARGRLGYAGTAAAPTASVLVPLVLVVLAAIRFFPSSEYVIGGKDPGGYINQGVSMATRGSLVIHDPEVAAIPAPVRTLFFNTHGLMEYFDNRFMGFFLQDPETGAVVGQFPHLYPASIALAYDIGGLRAALGVVGFWAVLGVVAVYLVGARLIGRPAAFAAGVLLTFNLAEVFFGGYPNTEVVMQALLFAAILALARAHQEGDVFFAPIAGVLAGLLIFLRQDAPLAVGALGVAAVAAWVVDSKRPRIGFIVPLAVAAIAGWFYWSGPMRATFWRTQMVLYRFPTWAVIGGLVAAVAGIALALRLKSLRSDRIRRAVPMATVAVLIALALYAWFLREPGGKLTDFDAAAFRTFVNVYAFPLGMIAALAGLLVVMPRHFWRDPGFMIVTAVFAGFFFYDLFIIPEHLWMARRFVPVILPATMLFAAAAALGTWERWPRGPQAIRAIIGALVLIILGQQYRIAAAPAVSHVEFKGLVEHMDELAKRFTDRDLVIVESRGSSDTHVMGIPLAYIYGQRVLVLENEVPDKAMFEVFLKDAVKRYDRVFFLGGGGTDLLSPNIKATAVTYVQRSAPSFIQSPWNAYQGGLREYKIDYTLYRLEAVTTPAGGFALDVGFEDDLQVVRFGGKEMTEGRTFRWTSRQGFVSVRGLTGREREVVFTMQDGGRPDSAPPAVVDVYVADAAEPLGRITVKGGFAEYRLPIPPEALKAMMTATGRQIRLVSTVWKPSEFSASTDTRDLGVMVDRVEIR